MEPKAAHKQLESPFDSDVEDECKLNLLPQPYREGRRLRNASYCHLNFTFYLGLGSYILNFVLGGLFIYYYSQMGPSNPLFPQMVYCEDCNSFGRSPLLITLQHPQILPSNTKRRNFTLASKGSIHLIFTRNPLLRKLIRRGASSTIVSTHPLLLIFHQSYRNSSGYI